MAVDPRLAGIRRRLAPVRRVLAVTGGKGGIGKSFVSSALALLFARRGQRVGLLDLDLTSPCDHLILGLDTGFPEEPFGVEPSRQHGLRFMSLAHFGGDHAAPLRGEDFSSALREILAITRWGELDVLVVDMPPGIGDAALDAARLLPRLEVLVLTTASRVVLETVRRTLEFLARIEADVVGLVENMARGPAEGPAALARGFGLPLLGRLPDDPMLEDAWGDPERLLACDAVRALDRVAERLVAREPSGP